MKRTKPTNLVENEVENGHKRLETQGHIKPEVNNMPNRQEVNSQGSGEGSNGRQSISENLSGRVQ